MEDIPTDPQKLKKKKSSGILGCDQCRRRKTKCDHVKPTCGPCIHAGLMECTYLLGKPPPPKRKKPQTEVGILEARLESIESAYSERIRHMEMLLKKVLPESQVQELLHGDLNTSPGQAITSQRTTSSAHRQQQGIAQSGESIDSDVAETDSSKENMLSHVSNMDQSSTSSMTSDQPIIPAFSRASTNSLSGMETKQSPRQETIHSNKLSQHVAHSRSSASPIAPAFTSPDNFPQVDSEAESGSDLDELAATMDKLRLFDASFYLGKGTMMFSSTDSEKWWDEEITFDVHEAPDIDIPPEALIMPPVDVIDALFEIYYSHYYVFMPMIQKATLLQALEDRYEPQSIFLLNSVFMAAAVTGECTDPSCYSVAGDRQSMGTPFFERARMVLDYCVGIPRVSTVQGLMMLSRYPKIAGLGHHFIQQAILMALDLGLHRKCDRWIPDEEIQETRKRVFWCIYALDSSTASITGRRPLIDNNEIDVPLLDPRITDGEFEYSNTLYLLHLCKLWRIYRDVKRYVFNVEDVQEMVSGNLPKSYEQQLIQWQLQLPAALRFSFDLDPNDPLAKYNARAGIAQMLYESILILLHKPFMSSSKQSKFQQIAMRSYDICAQAASKITSIAKTLIKTYIKTYQITGIGECAMANAIRILAVCIKSSDPKVAQKAQEDFDFLIRFFREYYSSPQVIIDKDMFNCVMSFFDEFIHTVNGLSESTVHVCASAIKSMAIAKRNKIAMRRSSTNDHDFQRPQPPDGDTRNLSRMVKIGREERARTKSCSPSAQSSKSSRTGSGGPKKRNNLIPHEDSQRFSNNVTMSLSKGDNENFMSSSDAVTTSLESPGVHKNPGKVQRISQYVTPFGGPAVMESLHQYQTSSAILNQPSHNAIPSSEVVDDDVFRVFQQQQQEHPQSVLEQGQQLHQQQQQQQQFFLQQQQHLIVQGRQDQLDHSQSLFNNPANQSVTTFDMLTPSFWGDFMGSDGMASQDPRAFEHGVLLDGPTIPPPAFEAMNSSTSIDNMYEHFQQGSVPTMMKPDVREKTIGGTDENLSADHIQALLEQTLAGDTPHNIPQSGLDISQHPQEQHSQQGSQQQNDHQNGGQDCESDPLYHSYHNSVSLYPHIFE